jgi:hypothetical protein
LATSRGSMSAIAIVFETYPPLFSGQTEVHVQAPKWIGCGQSPPVDCRR